jgi:uncharacterized membrane protein YeaQ/YmgE (transglycosylase-associated protein family)
MIGLIWAAVSGLIVGALGKLLMKGKDPGGIWITMGLGVAGSLIASFIGRALGWYHPGEGAGLIASVLGAMLLLWIYRMVRKGSSATA